MKIWHKILNVENPLIGERYFVYIGAPKATPGAGESAEKGKEKPRDKEKPVTLDDVKGKLGRAKSTIKRLWEGYSEQVKKNPDKFKKAIEKFNALRRVIRTIDYKIRKLEKQKSKRKQEVINRVNTEVDNLIYEITGKKPERVKVKPSSVADSEKSEKGKTKPRASTEVQKSKLELAKRELGQTLDEVYKNPDKFPELRAKMNQAIDNILNEMNIDLKNVKATQYIDLPGGYRMSIQKWTVNADRMPNAIIYKGRDLVCYKDYGVLRQSRLGQAPDAANNVAQIVKCFDQFPKSFRVVNNSFQITNQDNFVLMGMDIVKFSRQDKPWTARLASCRISYNPADKLLVIQPRGLMYKVVFNPNNTNKISFIRDGASKPDVWDMQQFVEKPKAQKARLNKEAKQRAERRRVVQERKKAEEQKREQVRREKANKELKDRMVKAEKAEVRGKVKKLLNPKFSKLVTQSKDDPKSFTVKAKESDRAGLRLINNTPIHKLLNLKQIKSEIVLITIKGAKGKPPRKAMYYPGQKTAYEVNSKGKQTNNRIKFYNGDTISLDFKRPGRKEYANLNRDKQVWSPERIEADMVTKKLSRSILKFKELGGKVSDLNLKPLEKYKSRYYDPAQILTMKNWNKKNPSKLEYKKAIEMLKVEMKVISEGLNRIAVYAD